MPDRVEREIEEILAKLDAELPPPTAAPDRRPISLTARRPRTPGPAARLRTAIGRPRAALTPAALLFTGAGVMVAGVILSFVWEPLIWAAFAGVVLFLGAFASSFFRPSKRPAAGPQGHFWRDRYIEYSPTSAGPLDRLKRRLRRR